MNTQSYYYNQRDIIIHSMNQDIRATILDHDLINADVIFDEPINSVNVFNVYDPISYIKINANGYYTPYDNDGDTCLTSFDAVLEILSKLQSKTGYTAHKH